MTQEEKIIWLEKLFILANSIGHRVGMTCFGIDMKQLPSGWMATRNRNKVMKSYFYTAHKDGLDITLFD